MLDITGLRVLGVAGDYAALHGLLRARRDELGVNTQLLNQVSGLSYCDKLLAPMPLNNAPAPPTAAGTSGRSGRPRSARCSEALAWRVSGYVNPDKSGGEAEGQGATGTPDPAARYRFFQQFGAEDPRRYGGRRRTGYLAPTR